MSDDDFGDFEGADASLEGNTVEENRLKLPIPPQPEFAVLPESQTPNEHELSLHDQLVSVSSETEEAVDQTAVSFDSACSVAMAPSSVAALAPALNADILQDDTVDGIHEAVPRESTLRSEGSGDEFEDADLTNAQATPVPSVPITDASDDGFGEFEGGETGVAGSVAVSNGSPVVAAVLTVAAAAVENTESDDGFGEFEGGEAGEAGSVAVSNGSPVVAAVSTVAAAAVENTESDDGFGEFEGGETAEAGSVAVSNGSPVVAVVSTVAAAAVENTESDDGFGEFEGGETGVAGSVAVSNGSPVVAAVSTVAAAAVENTESDDGFGEFEGGNDAPTSVHGTVMVPLSNGDDESPQPQDSADEDDDDNWDYVGDLSAVAPVAKSAAPPEFMDFVTAGVPMVPVASSVSAVVSADNNEDDDWGAFDSAPTTTAPAPVPASAPPKADEDDWAEFSAAPAPPLVASTFVAPPAATVNNVSTANKAVEDDWADFASSTGPPVASVAAAPAVQSLVIQETPEAIAFTTDILAVLPGAKTVARHSHVTLQSLPLELSHCVESFQSFALGTIEVPAMTGKLEEVRAKIVDSAVRELLAKQASLATKQPTAASVSASALPQGHAPLSVASVWRTPRAATPMERPLPTAELTGRSRQPSPAIPSAPAPITTPERRRPSQPLAPEPEPDAVFGAKMSLAEWMSKPASPPAPAPAPTPATEGFVQSSLPRKPSVVKPTVVAPISISKLPPALQDVVADTLKNLPDVLYMRLSYLKTVT